MRKHRAPYAPSVAVACLLVQAAFVLSPTYARAQTVATPSAVSPAAPSAPVVPPTPAQVARAKKLFLDGNALMKEELYQQALAAFVEANSLAPRESLQNNIARSHRLLKDMASAYREYEILLAKYGDKMPAARKADAMRALEDLAVLTGVAIVTVQEPDVAVTVDGNEAGRTPLAKPIRLNLGPHQIVLRKAGFEPFTQQVDLHGHDSIPVTGPMMKEILTGHLSVQVEPVDPSTQVLVDGAPVGPAPWSGELPPGSHGISAKSDGMASPTEVVTVAKKGTYEVTLKQVAQVGTLAVTVNVPAADITLDGKIVGRGAFEAQFPAGVHDLNITAPGYLPFRVSVNITPQQRTMQGVALVPAPIVVPEHDWTGVYSQLMFVGMFEPGKPSNDVAQGRGYSPDTQISGSSGAGGGLNVRVGYSFGLIGVEGSILASFDHSSAQANVLTAQSSAAHMTGTSLTGSTILPYTESFGFYRFGGEATIGARLMPKWQVVRPTLGIGAGIAVKAMLYSRTVTSSAASAEDLQGAGYSSTITPYIAPALNIDAGIEIGHTPGTRFYLGVLMQAEFDSATPASGVLTGTPANMTNNSGSPAYPAANIAVVSSTEIFIGPILGMQFGE